MKKYLLYLKKYITQIFSIVILLVLTGIIFPQQLAGQINCADCNASDFKVVHYYLASDLTGTPLNGVCSGNSQQVYLFLEVLSSSTRYSLYVEYDITTTDPATGISTTMSVSDCLYEFAAIPNSLINLSLNTGPFTWTCGDELVISNFAMSWKQKSDLGCTPEGPKCLCETEGIIVNAPLSVNFNWETYCSPGNGVSWIKAWSITNGGDGSYTNTWTYTGGTLENEIADTIWVSYPSVSSYSITLEVEDGIPQSDSETKSVTTIACCEDPVITLQPISETVCLNDPVSLSVTATVGTGGLSYQWQSSTDNFSSDISDVGGNSNTYSPPTSTVGTMYYRVIVSNTIAGCNDVTSDVVTVTINDPAAPVGDATQEFCAIDEPTVADLDATGDNIKWYADATGGSPLGSTTALVDGEDYFATQTVGECESDTRFEVTVTINDPAAPVGDATQEFCAIDEPTVADLDATGDNIKWYADATGGSPLGSTTALVDGEDYFATQTVGECESDTRFEVTVTINDPAAPVGDATQEFCAIDEPTVADLDATGDNIKWYADATGGSPLGSTTALVDGEDYFATQTVGECESDTRFEVTVTINDPAAPVGDATQEFCAIDEPTVADLDATGDNIKWYADATGGSPLGSTTALVDGEDYFATQTVGECESDTRFEVTVTINDPAAPVGDATQEFCAIDEPTVADLDATGDNIKWYADATGGSPLGSTTALVDGEDYFATQTVGECESDTRFEVTVTINDPAAPVGDATQEFCAIDEPTVADLDATGDNIKWYADATGGSPLGSTTALVDGEDYFATQTVGECESDTRFEVTVTINDPAAPVGDATQEFCAIDEPTVADLDATGDNIKWYADATGGSPLGSTTALVDGEDYFATQTVGECESDTRFEVTVTINDPAAPVGDATQEFCAIDEPTVADLDATGDNIKWYADATGGSPLGSTTALVDGEDYFATQTVGECESDTRFEVTVTINDPAAPVGDATQEFCAIDEPTVADLDATGDNIKWYADATGGSPLGSTTALVDGEDYFATQTVGECESDTRFEVTVTINDPAAPVGDATQEFCAIDEPTVADLDATGDNIKWYADATGGSPLGSTTALVDGEDYFATQTVGECESDTRFEVTVTINDPAAPVGDATQEFCAIDEPTVADLDATGDNIKWYADATGGSPLGSTTALVDGEDYFATQTVGECESDTRFEVTVTINDPAAPVGDATQEFCAIDEPTVADLDATGDNIKWYADATGGSPLGSTTALVDGEDYFATQTVGECESDTRFEVTVTINDPAAPVGDATQEFCAIDEPTVADLDATGDNIKWYADATGGSPLGSTTALVDGKDYFATQTVGECESDTRFEVTVTINDPAAPVGDATQEFCAIDEPTVADLDATGDNIKWYADATGGSPLGSTTALVDGEDYFATQTVGECESDTRFEVTVTINDPAAPVGDATQEFCAIDEPTVADLDATGDNIKWYADATGGSPLGSTTALVDGEDYFATQTVGECESDTRFEVTVTINDPAAPVGDATQEFCAIDEPTVADLDATGDNIKWYADATGGSPLGSTTALVDGEDYFATQTVGECESDTRFEVTVTINDPAAPVGDATQEFCAIDEPTVADLDATGDNIKWYADATGGSPLGSTTALVDGEDYFATQTVGECESDTRFEVTVTINDPAAPVGDATQEFCAIDEPTVADLDATGDNIKWYADATGGSPLGSTTALVDGEDYFATQTVGECESDTRFEVTVTINDPAAPVGDATQEFCAIDEPTVADLDATGDNIKWYADATGGSPLGSTTALVDGEDYFATQTVGECESDTRFEVTVTINDPAAPVGDATQEFCAIDEPTVADLDATGDNIKWYADATGGSPLGSTTALVDGEDYFATQTVGECESDTRFEVTVTINDPAAPVGDATQEFCAIDEPTVADLDATGDNIKWYADATGGSPLGSTTALVDGEDYFATQTVGECESDTRFEVTVTINDPAAPVGDATQEFCAIDEPTVADLDATGDNIKWYADATGGSPLGSTTALVDGEDYFATQTVGECESDTRFEVTVTVLDPAAPTGTSPQIFCSDNNPTINSLSVSGSNIRWYDSPVGGTLLPGSTPLANGIPYFATQTISGCESEDFLQITANVYEPLNVALEPLGELNCNNSQITLNSVINGEIGSVTYFWSTPDGNIVSGEFTADIILDQPGEYTLKVIDSGSECEVEESITITENINAPIANISPSHAELTCDTTTIVLDASVSTGQGALSYSWGTGQTTSQISVSSPGIYTVTVTDAGNGCTDVASIEISQNIIPPVADIQKSEGHLTCAIASITLDGSGSTGQSTLNYLWSTGEITEDIEVAATGTYELTITDTRNGCSNTTSVRITQDVNAPEAIINEPFTTELNCVTEEILLNASASVDNSGGANLEYLWSTGETTSSVTVDEPGVYSVTVTDPDNGCSDETSITITQDINAPVAVIDEPLTTELNCVTEEILLDASVSVDNSGGANLEYLWSTGETTSSVTIDEPGVYSVTVTDQGNGCTSETSITITQDINSPVAVIEEPATTELNCDIDGITLDASASVDNSGASNLQFDWSGGETTPVISATEPGIYTVTVTDLDNGCTSVASVEIFQDLNATEAIIETPATTILTCEVSEIMLDASNSIDNSGEDNLLYEWSTGETTSSITVDVPGAYVVTVTDPDNGCSSLASQIITQDLNAPGAIIEESLTTELNCVTEEILLDASVSVDNSGSANLEFLWSTGETTSSLTVDGPGAYSVTVTDPDNGCSDETSITITQDISTPEAIIVEPGTTVLTCSELEISLDASASVDNSGSANLKFLWSTGETTSSLTVDGPGVYSVTVTDPDNGCSDETSITITQDISTPEAIIVEPGTTVLTCSELEISLDASASVDNSGSANLEFLWSTGETTSSLTFDGPGVYSVTVTDPDNGCSDETSITITQDISTPEAIIVEPGTTVLTCSELEISLDASTSVDNSGSANLKFLWSTGETTSSLTVDGPGVYSVTVTDPDNGCSDETSITITQDISTPEAIIVEPGTTVLTCSELEISLDASASVDNSGSANLEFLWSTGETTSSLTVDGPGVYSVTVTDPDNGCSDETSITITQDISTHEAIIVEPGTTVLTCSELEISLDASASVDNSGSANLEFLWSTGETTSSLTVDGPGVYSVTVTDPDNGCSDETSITITQDISTPEAIIVEPGTTVLTCSELEISLDASASVDNSGSANLEFLWSTGETTSSLTVDGPGIYSVTVTDPDNGCTDQVSIEITENETISCDIIINNDPTCFGGSDASATVTVTGGGGDYTYLWDNGETTATAVALNNGTHNVEVTDQYGCTTSCSVVITDPDDLVAVAESNGPVCSGSDVMLFENSGQATSWEWSGPNGFTSELQNPIISNANTLNSGQYQVIIGNGSCSDTVTIIVTINPQPNAVDDDYNTIVNTGVEGSVLDNDAIIGGSSLTVSLVDGTEPNNGTLNLESDGSFTYTPNTNFVGEDNFTYLVCSDEGCCDEALVTINVESAAATDPPFANNDYYSTTCLDIEGQNVLDNDIYLLGVSIQQASGTNNGTLTLNEDGTFVYRPLEGFVGQDRFTYRLCYNDEPDNCSNLAEVLIDVDCPCELFIPNGFSPNGDNVNDYFEILCLENYPNAHLLIYNRWGSLVYEQEDYGNSDRWGDTDRWWDGRSTNKFDIGNDILPAATYMYILILEENGDTRTGTIFLNK